MDGITLREAKATDIEAIVLLWRELMGLHADLDRCFTLTSQADPLFRAFLEKNLVEQDAIVVLAEDLGRPVGYTMAIESDRPPVFEHSRTVLITDMIVTASHRGRGIGRCLVDRIKAWALTRDVAQLEVMAATGNPAAQAFWRKVGARPYLATLVFEDPGTGG